jgi:hypothetical protein
VDEDAVVISDELAKYLLDTLLWNLDDIGECIRKNISALGIERQHPLDQSYCVI